ncbi:MAG: hypothetical protein ACQESR_20400 [Planctomycetota bacterium]
MERCPTQAVLPPVGVAAEKVIRDRYNTKHRKINNCRMIGTAGRRPNVSACPRDYYVPR